MIEYSLPTASQPPSDPCVVVPTKRRRHLRRRALGAASGLVLVAALAAGCGSSGSSTDAATTVAGGGGGAEAPAGCVAAQNGAVEIKTTNFDFSPDCVTTTGTTLKVTYDNQEKGVKHNIDFKELKSSTGGAATDLKSGPNTQTITLVDLKPGTYTYVCDIHASMTGKLTVK